MRFVAEKLGVAKSAVRVVKGLASRGKKVEVTGIDQAVAYATLVG